MYMLFVKKHIFKGKVKVVIIIENPSQSHGASPTIWDHTVLSATQHR